MPTALIVDDEPEANKLLSMLVQLRGYRTRSAFTGEEALALARDDRPDVVFLDLMLPDLTGFEVCRELRSDRETSLVPVVVVTARLADRNRVESYQAGTATSCPSPTLPTRSFAPCTTPTPGVASWKPTAAPASWSAPAATR